MVNRKRKKNRKYLGTRSHGKGNIKTGRGNGSRGGTGNAGLCKHKGTWIAANDPNYYGRSVKGFVNHARKPRPKAVNLYELNHMAVTGKLEKKGEKYTFKFDGKILGTGSVSVPLNITAKSWSKKTEEKIKSAGGEIAKTE